jgi:hypothetical protein
MGATFTPEQLGLMFQAFDRARRVSSDDPDTIAIRIIAAASVGIQDSDALFAAGVGAIDQGHDTTPESRFRIVP